MNHRAIDAISRRQHGVFSRRQLVDAGCDESMIDRRLASGVWVRLHRSVYADPAVPRSFEQVALAACLACGADAAVSHESAGVLLGFELAAPGRPVVTVPWPRQVEPVGVRVVRTRHLARHEVALVGSIPVTSAQRTLANLAGVLDPGRLEICLDQAWRKGMVDPDRLAGYLSDSHQRSRKGVDVLRALVGERVGQRAPGSWLETVYIQILRTHAVPLPVRQHEVMTRSGRRFIDLAYPDARVAIELEGFEPHATIREVFEDDRVRRNDLDALGWSIRMFTRTQCLHDPAYVATTTAAAVGLVPAAWARRVP